MNTRHFIKNILCFFILTLAVIPCHAKLSVTKLTCNYQQGLAVTQGDIRMGWQMTSDVNGDAQAAYQIKIYENFTDKTIYDSGKTISDQSQLVSL
ncbi:MAG: hypothetical protein LUD48_01915, partial [Prevotella sp.]|nr:hypothetical protein [Prevotella sp.]